MAASESEIQSSPAERALVLGIQLFRVVGGLLLAFFLVERLGADPRLSALLGAGTVVGLRLAALHLGWRLPVLKPKNSR